jgi:hypothetical protein
MVRHTISPQPQAVGRKDKSPSDGAKSNLGGQERDKKDKAGSNPKKPLR